MPSLAQIPSWEEERLVALARYDILDTDPEARFDRVTQLVADILGAPISLITLVDRDRSWIKSSYGLDVTQTPRDISICAHALLDPKVTYIADTGADARFADHPLVCGAPYVRTYAGAPLIGSDGMALGVLCAVYDEVTEVSPHQLRQLQDLAAIVMDELDLRRTRREAEDAQAAAEKANAAKSEFLSCMSHEVRTPLNGILGMAAALHHTPLQERQTRMVDIIADSGGALLNILTDILDLARIEAGELGFETRDFDLDDVVDRVSQAHRPSAAAKGIALTTALDAGLSGTYRGDPVRIQQLLEQLVANAIKFTDEGGVSLTVSMDETSEGGTEGGNDGSNDGARTRQLRFAVADTGIGISQEYQAEIFAPFKLGDGATARKYGGAGVGLTLCTRLAAAMGGAVTAESELGEGSVFTVTLPLEFVGTSVPVSSPRHQPVCNERRDGPRRRLKCLAR